MISRAAPNKVVGLQVENNVKHNSTITSADCYSILPQIQPESSGGISTQVRNTDRVKPKSLVLRGTLGLQYVGVGTNPPESLPIYVRVLILQQKDIKSGAVIGAGGVDTSNLFRAALPSGDQVGFNGDLTSLNYPVNKNKFRVYMDKIIMLHTSDISHSNGGDNPGFSRRFKHIFKSNALPKALTYDESSPGYANNFAPFIAIGWAYADGTTTAPGNTLVNANVYSQLVFEDA